MPVTLALNPKLDRAALARRYRANGVVQVQDVLAPEAAEAIAQVLERGVDWRLFVSDAAGKGETLTRAEISAAGPAAMNTRLSGVMQRAGEGFGFLYFGYPMLGAYLDGSDPDHPLHEVTEFLNSEPFLELGRAITGELTVRKTDAQATFYRRGDFLTLHDDTGEDRERCAAYTLGFTRKWRPDWGGQLLFHDETGEVERGLLPGFNVLTLFKVPRQHSVAPVAPYAAGPRLSIVGWLRDDPPKPIH